MKISKFGTKNALFGYFWDRILKNYWHIWNQNRQIFQIGKNREKMKMSKFGTKNALFGCFWARILKNYCHIWNHHPRICPIVKFREKMKMPKFGPKIPYLRIFGLEFENNIVIFEITTLEFVQLRNFVKKWKCLNLGPKIPYLCIFGLKFVNNIFIFASSNLSNRKVLWNNKKCLNLGMKMSTFFTKNAYFWAKILKNYCHIWNQNPRIGQTAKFREKMKMHKFGNKNTLCRYFWARILKNNLPHLKSEPLNLSNSKIFWKIENA